MNVNVTIEIKFLVSEAQKQKWTASGGLQWQYIVNCHIVLVFLFVQLNFSAFFEFSLSSIRGHAHNNYNSGFM